MIKSARILSRHQRHSRESGNPVDITSFVILAKVSIQSIKSALRAVIASLDSRFRGNDGLPYFLIPAAVTLADASMTIEVICHYRKITP